MKSETHRLDFIEVKVNKNLIKHFFNVSDTRESIYRLIIM